jgi:uncharacterized protein (TIGR03437 family)
MMRSTALAAALLLVTTAFAEWEDRAFMVRRQRHFDRSRSVPDTVAAADLRIRAIRQMDALPRLRAGERWKLIGPRPSITTTGPSAGAPLASGRVTSLAVDPRNSDVAYLGAAEGGVWKTLDGGRNWLPLTDDQISLAIGSLAIDASAPDTVYAGTGEENFAGNDSYYGAGVLKSTDGGKTWNVVGSMFAGPSSAASGGAHIGSLAVHPADGRILLAAVQGKAHERSGIYRSEDAGVTWKVVLPGAPGTAALFNPAAPNIAYAALGNMNGSPVNGIYKSNDAGLTWTNSSGGIPAGIGRVNLTLSAADPRVLYTAIQQPHQDAPLGVFKTTDAGATWSPVAVQPGYCSRTCWYANTIQVAPANPDVVLVGGLNSFLSQDGGKTWRNVTEGANGNFIHWDVHAMAFSYDGARLYIGTDGGVYRGENVATEPPDSIGWNNLNDTLAITQFYQGCSTHPDTTDFIVCGTQDNGTQVYTGGPVWQMAQGGDGGWTAVDRARPSVFYMTAAGEVDIEKSSPFGEFRGFLKVINGLHSIDSDNCSFTPPLAMDPANPLRLYFGCRRVYQTQDGAGRWLPVSPDLVSPGQGGTGFITAIAVAPANSDRVYVGDSGGGVHVTSNATAGTDAAWVHRGSGLPRRPVTALAVDAAHHETAYVAFSGFSGFSDKPGHVFKTIDAGQTWSDITSNLPNVPVNTFVIDPDMPKSLYAGTDIGVFASTDDGGTWAPLGDGLPKVAVVDIHLHRGARLLRAATHGRSMWEFPLPRRREGTLLRVHSAVPEPIPLPDVPSLLAVKGAGFAKDAVVRWNGAVRGTQVTSESTLTVLLPPGDLNAAGRATVSVHHPGVGISNLVNLDIGGPPEIAAVVNAASGQAGTEFAKGTIVSIYGQNLASGTASHQGSHDSKTLADTSVEVKSFVTHLGYPASLLFVSPTQINFVLPFDLPADPTPSLNVVAGTRMSALLPLTVRRYSPGLFSLNAKGTGQGWVACASDGMIAGPASANSRPARPGERIIIYGTGLGPVWDDNNMIAAPEVTIGKIGASVEKAVLVASVPGLYEVTVEVPKNAPSGSNILVSLMAGGDLSNVVSIAIE